MVITNYHARILHLGEVKEKNGFHNCYATIETEDKKGEDGDTIYKREKFEVEVKLDKEGNTYKELAAFGDNYFPATFMLRSFIYQEKGKDKLGKQLQLRRWKR